jgi:hypothetical protein
MRSISSRLGRGKDLEALTAEDLAMAEKCEAEPLEVRDRVKIRHSGWCSSEVVNAPAFAPPGAPGGRDE